MSLQNYRQKIDRIDEQLVTLLNARTKLALEIGKDKKARNEEIYAPAREKDVLRKVSAQNPGPLKAESMRAIYREIMSAALSLEHPLKIAFLGPVATFTHQAARARFGASVTYEPCETIADVFRAVENGRADYGVAPIENSTEGAVTPTLDELAETPLKICAEVYLPISQNLLARCPRNKLKKIYSIPQAFAQCRKWLNTQLPGVELIAVSSTARGAELAAKETGAGAIAGKLAAELLKLRVLEADIQDLSGNTTRFLVLGRHSSPPSGADKTSIYFSVKHHVGALYHALAAFNRGRINMTKIESRPSKSKVWEYFFFVDLEGHAEDAPIKKALRQLHAHCTLITVLGSYPKADLP